VLVAGGTDSNAHVLPLAELYSTSSGTFTPTGSLATPRQSLTLTILGDGKVLATGGVGPSSNVLATAEN